MLQRPTPSRSARGGADAPAGCVTPRIGVQRSLCRRRVRCRAAASTVASEATSTALKVGINRVQGPRKTLEDVLRVEQGLNGGFTYAAVLDGHGGELSAQWLYDELFEAILPYIDDSLLDDGDERPPSGLSTPGAPGSPAPRPPTPGGVKTWPPKAAGKVGVARRMLPGVRWPARLGEVFTDVFRRTDERLLHFLRSEFGDDVMGLSGSTALVALVHPEKAIFASLGDCVAAVCRGGVAVKATQQHRVHGVGPDVSEEVARVESTGAWVVDGRVCNVLAVSRAFGDPEFKGVGLKTLLASGARRGMWSQEFAAAKEFASDPVIVVPDVTEIRLLPQDEFIIMGTDGLWDCMPVNDAVTYARKQFRSGKDAQQVAEAMTSIALRRYTADNVGVVVIDLRRDGGGGGANGGANGGGKNLFGGIFGGGGR
ncbi:MAG: phosphatase 2C-like domain-containing protein [Monoraphidium minutum]|nr:MAG: phosphatase 2C-like domain-containing protein [Monoraphidium minutum]